MRVFRLSSANPFHIKVGIGFGMPMRATVSAAALALGGALAPMALRAQDAAVGKAASVASLAEGLQVLTAHVNTLWVLVAAAMVFLMQAGFMCLECGMSTAKHSINVAIKNLSDFIIAVLGFWLVGFGLMFGDTLLGVVGFSGFAIDAENSWRAAFFMFQAVFVGTAATILSGAVSGRMRFGAYLLLSAIISTLVYPVFGHWAWGSLLNGGQQGWLEALGFKDFAGSTVVHSVGGWMALVTVYRLGPRLGKFDADGTARRIPPHNLLFTYLGTFILLFGWFGFNAGSTLEATPAIASIAMNTLVAASTGGFAGAAMSWLTSPYRRPEGELIANGLLGGLVAITAGCAFVNAYGAAAIGLVGGVLVVVSADYLEHRLKLDDVVSAIPVHAVCGAWGTVAVGLFIRSEHLGDLSRLQQIAVQLTGVGVAAGWTLGAGWVAVTFVDQVCGGLRVSEEDERIGLNVSEHGASSGILDLVQAMHQATVAGNFRDLKRVPEEYGTEAGELALSFNRMIGAIKQAIRESEDQKRVALNALQEVEARHRDALLREERIRLAADDVDRVVHEAERCLDQISTSGDLVTSELGSLQQQSTEIDHVIEILNTLSREINMLSINAMVEAAKAGDYGKTFTVVAQEVRRLGGSTKGATSDVSGIIAAIHDRLGELVARIRQQADDVQRGTETVNRARDIVRKLVSEPAERASGNSDGTRHIDPHAERAALPRPAVTGLPAGRGVA